MIDEEFRSPAVADRRRRLRHGAAAARALLGRIAAGESLRAVCRDPAMPASRTVSTWVAERPQFAAALRAAREQAGMPLRSGGRSSYCEDTAHAILRRMWAGEALTRICEDPQMPVAATVYRWRREREDFAAALAEAFEIRAEGFFERGWEIAEAITPASAMADKVRLHHLRWHVGRLAPKRYGLAADRAAIAEAQETARAQAEGKGGMTVIIRRFSPHWEYDPDAMEHVIHHPPPGDD